MKRSHLWDYQMNVLRHGQWLLWLKHWTWIRGGFLWHAAITAGRIEVVPTGKCSGKVAFHSYPSWRGLSRAAATSQEGASLWIRNDCLGGRYWSITLIALTIVVSFRQAAPGYITCICIIYTSYIYCKRSMHGHHTWAACAGYMWYERAETDSILVFISGVLVSELTNIKGGVWRVSCLCLQRKIDSYGEGLIRCVTSRDILK